MWFYSDMTSTTTCAHRSLLQVAKPDANSSGYPCFYRCESCGNEYDELADVRTTAGDKLRAEAANNDRLAAESFERCDTDGWASQAAQGLMGQLNRRLATIADNGGKAEFLVLLDLDGNIVPAKLIETQYGQKFAIFDSFDDMKDGNIEAWVNPWVKRRSTLANKGYKLGQIEAPAHACHAGGGKGLAGMASVYVKTFMTEPLTADATIVDDDYWHED